MQVPVKMPQADDPLVQMADDRNRARSAGDPCADRCYLATVSSGGEPAVRTLALRRVEAGCLEIYFNATSPMWHQLQANPRYELLVYWPTIARQYRVSGGFEQISPTVMGRSWKHRSRVGKCLDLYYSADHPQSSLLESQDDFDAEIEKFRRSFEINENVNAPSTIRGLRLLPWRVDFLDLPGEEFVHRRYLYTRGSSGWTCRPLVP